MAIPARGAIVAAGIVVAIVAAGVAAGSRAAARVGTLGGTHPTPVATASRNQGRPAWDRASEAGRAVARAAEQQAGTTVKYDAAYVKLAYPGGDVPADRGVCTDVVIRAFRTHGVDLQVAVHEDMTRHFSAYPDRWGLAAPDASIDHRRVPNLQKYFARTGKSLKVTHTGSDYWPGDVVTWDTWGRPHTGIVSTVLAANGTHYLMAHNFGGGVKIEDALFAFPVTGHYRCF